MDPNARHPLHALHLAALARGSARCVERVGDAEARLWEAPAAQVLRRGYQDGVRRSELHALLGADGLPLAWWQRCSGAPPASRSTPAWRLPFVVPHRTLHVVDGVAHGLGVDEFIDELARRAGRPAAAYRRDLMRARGWPRAVPAAGGTSRAAAVTPPPLGGVSPVSSLSPRSLERNPS